jgi:HEAT repeat protein
MGLFNKMNPLRYLAAGSLAFISAATFAGQVGGGWGTSAQPMMGNSANGAYASPNGSAVTQAPACRAEEVLDKKIEANYTRQYLSEIVADLRARAKLETVYPLTLNRSFNFTLADKNADVKTILDKVVAAGNLEKEIKNGVVIFTQKADDKLIADLTTKLQDADRWKRCEAVWQLANLADKRIYPLLFKAAADSDNGVVFWTLKGLLAHLRMLPFVDDPAKDNVVKALKKDTDILVNDENFIRDYFRLMGAVSTPLAFDTLAAYAKSPDATARLNAVLGLEQCKEPRAADAYQAALKEPIIADRKKYADSQSLGAYVSYARLDVRVNDPFLPQEMGNPRNPTIRDVMLEMIKDPASSADERKYAAQTLSNYLNDSKSIGDALAVLQNVDHDLKKAAIFGSPWGGGMVGGARWTDDKRCNHDSRWVEFETSFLKDTDAKLRDQAIQSFARIGNPWSTRATIQVLKEGEIADKISALRGLDPNFGYYGSVTAHRLNDPLLLEAVATFLNSDNARQQKISAMVLTTYNDTRTKDPLFKHLNAQLVDEHNYPAFAMQEKVQTLKLLSQAHDTRAVDAIVALMRDNAAMGYRQQLVACLVEMSDPHGNDALLELARDKQADINARSEVAQALVGSKNETQAKVALDTLMDVLKGQQMFGPFAAMNALNKAQPASTDALISFFKDTGVDAARRVSAAELLSGWEMDSATTDKFVALFDDKTIDAGVRSAVARGVSGYKPFMPGKPEKVDGRVVNFLITAFKGTADGDDSRPKIANALANTRDEKALAALNEALTGTNEGLKKDATLGLASIHDPKALDPIITLLNNSDSKTVMQFNNLVSVYANDPTVAEADRAKAKKAMEAAAPKVKAFQEEQMAQAMKQFNNNQKPVKPPAPPSKSDF